MPNLTPAGPDNSPLKKMEAGDSFTKHGKVIRKGKERLRYNPDPEKNERLAIAAEESLQGTETFHKLRSWNRRGRYVTVEVGNGKTIDLNINSLAKRLHLSKKRILEISDKPQELKKLIDDVDQKALKKELDFYRNPNEVINRMRQQFEAGASTITNSQDQKIRAGLTVESVKNGILNMKFSDPRFVKELQIYEDISDIALMTRLKYKPEGSGTNSMKSNIKLIMAWCTHFPSKKIEELKQQCGWKVFAYRESLSENPDSQVYKQTLALLDKLYDRKDQHNDLIPTEKYIKQYMQVLKRLSEGKGSINDLIELNKEAAANKDVT